jgi:DNA-binding response OmpR family regulator
MAVKRMRRERPQESAGFPSTAPMPETLSSMPPSCMRLRGKVLVIDDEELIRKALPRMLRDSCQEVLTASGGKEGLRLLSEDGSISLIVLDAVLPDIRTADMLAAIRSIRDVKVLVCSGYPEENFPGARADAWLEKPFRVADLLACVDALFRPSGGNDG